MIPCLPKFNLPKLQVGDFVVAGHVSNPVLFFWWRKTSDCFLTGGAPLSYYLPASETPSGEPAYITPVKKVSDPLGGIA